MMKSEDQHAVHAKWDEKKLIDRWLRLAPVTELCLLWRSVWPWGSQAAHSSFQKKADICRP